ncbi:hydroxymethylglutaryl-CoA synthase family protein [Brevibacillus dissolubilis]|uniref:hydroxymethylglutaryl-CoA synthase family protein n=1 Tax=Brevibacillus dissolubilis TaxID=1844116 RepID=UPI001115D7B5|nr:hydroxymethylglutaryl-CoA synthase family protein [Brevibacillus dissolubilis]
MRVGIELMNFYGGPAYIDVRTLFSARGLDLERFDNLMMEKKAVGLPCEDPVTNAVNAAKPILDRLTDEEKSRIEMIITSSESGLDFGKSLATYVHDYLGVSRTCRLFEVKQACYGGTAALQMAAGHIASQASPGCKVLVIATDVAKSAKLSYAEPSQATGAVAMLISDKPDVLELDFGANGLYSYEVMDTCRPLPDEETGDPDMSLLSYLDCLENSFKAYQERVEDADFRETFHYLAFHCPFAGMVKGAHRKMLRGLYRAKPDVIEADFVKRVLPSLGYSTQVGNVYSAGVYLALCGLIDHADISGFTRIGLFSYGSGCSSEFYSGIVTPRSKEVQAAMGIRESLNSRYALSMPEYELLVDLNKELLFGVKECVIDTSAYQPVYDHYFAGKGRLVLKSIDNYHRKYGWS